MRRLFIAVFFVTLGFATAAAAGGDVCLFDDDNDTLYRLTKPKAPKGDANPAAPLVGVAFIGGIPAGFAVSGSWGRVDDYLVVGLTRYGQFCLVTGVLGQDLNGSFSYDCNMDGVIEESSLIEALDCDAL